MKIISIRKIMLAVGFILALGGNQVVSATVISSSLGNTTSGFNNNDILTVPQIGTAQGGQDAPFDQGYGTDGLFGGNFMEDWTFSYGMISDIILSASLTIGIYDHDSTASGSQLALYDIDGTNLTGTLDMLFEADSAADRQYNEYTINLAASSFSDLADGMAMVTLNLQGPGLVERAPFLGGGFVETTTNGANLIFSTLTIVTEDAQPVPAPSSFLLVSLGILLMGVFHRRRLAKEV